MADEKAAVYEAACAALDAWQEKIPAGRWRHCKGKEYEVLGLALHSETLEVMVVYRALYGAKTTWVRPAALWCEAVMRTGQCVPRFTYLG